MVVETKAYENNPYKPESEKEEKESYNPLDIWRVNPAFKDISTYYSEVKMISFMFIIFFMIYITFILTSNVFAAIGWGITFGMFFIFAFHDNIHSLENGFMNKFRTISEINPFEHTKFYMLRKDPATIFILNKKEMFTIATRIFKLETLAENVKPNISQFLYALDESKVPYTYQVVQRPIIKMDPASSIDMKKKIEKRQVSMNSIESSQTHIYFSIYHKVKGILNDKSLSELLEGIISLSKTLKASLASNFHHTKITLLELRKQEENEENPEDYIDAREEETEQDDPINALRTIFFKEPLNISPEQEVYTKPEIKSTQSIYKLVSSASLIGYLTYSLVLLGIMPFVILAIDIALGLLILLFLWRELLFNFTYSNLKQYDIIELNPFSEVRFYCYKPLNDTLYIHVNNYLLKAIKIFNLVNAVQPSFAMPDKFFRAMSDIKSSFTYTMNTFPLTKREFVQDCSKKLNDKTKADLEGIIYDYIGDEPKTRYKHPDAEFLNWWDKRTGIWKTFLTISTSAFSLTNAEKLENFEYEFNALEDVLSMNAKTMERAFQQNFKNLYLTQLKGQMLSSGFQFECLKNKDFRLHGSHLGYVNFQGQKLAEFANLASEFRKGVETRIAAEFNTPLHIQNFIIIGSTINTEFWQTEVAAGFTLNQMKSILITNGTSEDREHLKMKMVQELVKAGISSIIFDNTGDWSKLIRSFKGTDFEDQFLHFKLGQAFNLNLIYSGMKHDAHNLEYLNYFYDAFTLAFKIQRNTLDLLKKSVQDNESLDWSSVALELKIMPDWAKNKTTNNLLNILKDFLDMNVFFSDKALEYENDIAPLDFIKTNKTVIIDLSPLRDLEQQSFATFIMLSKFVHYVNHSSDYQEKIIFIPNVDLYFDQFFIDNNNNPVNYGKIDKLLSPLLQNGFGLAFSANQIRYLHPHIFNYLNNLITFRATDSRDIALLKNTLHLQELHGAGYYSSKRNNTYQFEYLMTMRNREVIVKRDDIFQPFPVEIDNKKIFMMLPWSDENIYDYMQLQGYNLKESEHKLLARLKKTRFERDIGIYKDFIEPVKKFLNGVRSVQKIGNLSKNALKQQLKTVIYPTASKKTHNRKQIDAIRNDLLEILINHGYLIESHPNMASGKEATRTSYIVGDIFQKALDDEAKATMNRPVVIPIELSEQSEIDVPLSEKEPDLNFNESLYSQVLLDKIVDLVQDLAKINSLNKSQDYEQAIEKGKNLMNSFFAGLYKVFIEKNVSIGKDYGKLSAFVEFLAKNRKIPFTMNELREHLNKINNVLKAQLTMEEKTLEIYNFVSNFSAKLWHFMDGL